MGDAEVGGRGLFQHLDFNDPAWKDHIEGPRDGLTFRSQGAESRQRSSPLVPDRGRQKHLRITRTVAVGVGLALAMAACASQPTLRPCPRASFWPRVCNRSWHHSRFRSRGHSRSTGWMARCKRRPSTMATFPAPSPWTARIHRSSPQAGPRTFKRWRPRSDTSERRHGERPSRNLESAPHPGDHDHPSLSGGRVLGRGYHLRRLRLSSHSCDSDRLRHAGHRAHAGVFLHRFGGCPRL
jgi:hypothetical protein